MSWYLKDDTSKSKCNGCVHSHIVRSDKNNTRVTICRMLGFSVGPIVECNQFRAHINAGIPIEMLQKAYLIGDDTKSNVRRRMGFGAGTSEAAQSSIDIDDDDDLRGNDF